MAQVGQSATLPGKNSQDTTTAGVAGSSRAGKAPLAAGAKWQPFQLGRDFRLDDAVDQALSRAAGHINRSMQAEGLVVSLPQAGSETAEAKTIKVSEKETNAVLKTYDVPSFLAFYANREKTSGLIVDGQV